ncbi:MAG: hypothetical protein Q8N21_04560 [bacterium]|nr:hypothetical protein [bacterium]
MTIWEFLVLTWQWLGVEYEDGQIANLREVINDSRDRVEQWWRWGRRITLLVIIISFGLSLISIGLGVWLKNGVPNAIVGILIAPFLFIMVVWWTPLASIFGVVVEIIYLRFKTAPEKALQYAKLWLGIVASILMWELIICFAFTYVPYWNKPSRIPGMLLCSLIIAITGIKWMRKPWYKKIITAMVIFMLAANVVACFLPKAAQAVPERISKIDEKGATILREGWPQKPEPTCTSPRDISWMTFKITPAKQDFFRVYAGDTIYYFADKGFWVEYEDGNKYFNNPSYDGQMMEFTITTANEKGEIARVWSDETLQLKYRVKSRG